MPSRATGTFTVQLTPDQPPDMAEGIALARMSLRKQLHGDLEGESIGTMLTAAADVKNSAVYVVVERITGTLDGKRGAFALAHKGVMTRGAPVQDITVVPDSGQGELRGISGRFTVIIEGGEHRYELDYSFE